MKALCISCFNSFGIHVSKFTEYFSSLNYEVKYAIQDFDHVRKKYFPRNYPNTDVVNIHVPDYKNNVSPKRLISHYIFSKKIYKLLCEFKPDIIYCMFPPNMLVREVSKYKKNYGAKVIFDFWDSWPEAFPLKHGKRYALLKPFLNYWCGLRDNYLENADLLLTNSSVNMNLLKKKYPNNICKLLYPSRKSFKTQDLPKYNFSNIDKEISFCYLGNVNYITDIDFAFKFFSELVKHKKITMHIIGEGTNFDIFIEKLKSLGVNIFSYGVVYDDSKKSEIFSKCHLGLTIPIPEIGSNIMPLKATEYIRAGLPVINTAKGDLHDLIENHNLGINIENVNDIPNETQKILILKTDNLINMSNNCIENYTKIFNQDLSVILNEVI